MNIKRITLICLFLIITTIFLQKKTYGYDSLNSVLTNIESTNRKMVSLQATISHQHTNAQLDIKDVKQVGTLIYKLGANRCIRIDYTQPQQKIVSITGDKAILFERELNQVFISTVNKFASKNSSYELLAVLNSVSQLKDQFDISLIGEEPVNGQITSHIVLIPKRQNSKYTRVEAWIDHKTWLPARQILYERNKDYTEIYLSNFVVNPKLSDHQFEVNFGKAKVIRG